MCDRNGYLRSLKNIDGSYKLNFRFGSRFHPHPRSESIIVLENVDKHILNKQLNAGRKLVSAFDYLMSIQVCAVTCIECSNLNKLNRELCLFMHVTIPNVVHS
jgi:hypothetical protein